MIDQSLSELMSQRETINKVSLIMNCLVKESDFYVNSVFIAPTSYFLYSSTKGSII